MFIDMYVDCCIDRCIEMSFEMSSDMFMNMCMDVCVDILMFIDMCTVDEHEYVFPPLEKCRLHIASVCTHQCVGMCMNHIHAQGHKP